MRWLFLFLMLVTSAVAAQPDFAPGQEWSLKNSTMKVVIGRIDTLADGKAAVSISVFDVPSPPNYPVDHPTMSMGHVPMDRDALAASVDSLLATGVAPDTAFEEGYKIWKDANGGVFTLTVQDIVAGLLKMPPPHD